MEVIAFMNMPLSLDISKNQVINVNSIDLLNIEASGIETIKTENVIVYVTEGHIQVEGEYDYLNIYTLDGRQIRNEALSPGIYLVKVKVGNSMLIKKVFVDNK